MSDPAEEAVQRVFGPYANIAKRTMSVSVAREALKPIRQVVENWRDSMNEAMWEELAPLIFSTKELTKESK